jgi:hypothetical protein
VLVARRVSGRADTNGFVVSEASGREREYLGGAARREPCEHLHEGLSTERAAYAFQWTWNEQVTRGDVFVEQDWAHLMNRSHAMPAPQPVLPSDPDHPRPSIGNNCAFGLLGQRHRGTGPSTPRTILPGAAKPTYTGLVKFVGLTGV